MSRWRDPIESRETSQLDLYEVTTWEPRSWLDRLSVAIHSFLGSATRAFLILLAVLILVVEIVIGGVGVLTNPLLGLFTILSAVPALGLALYVWYVDATPPEPLKLLVMTFVLGVLFAGFAAVVNSAAQEGALAATGLNALPFAGMALFFYLVVGPVEETVKLLAVRLYAYRHDRFGAVIDGAVYGAMAGLGFATIENAIYIARSVAQTPETMNFILQGGATATVRALAGPGHVIYSSFAGYYLGLARFNRESAGPIIVKGLLIAALIHGTYNTIVSPASTFISQALSIPGLLAFLIFVLLYDGLFGALLFRKLQRYTRTYKRVHAGLDDDHEPERTEFDP
ncbi:PrsW family intramembrane metalloprotease [Haloarculaceae archaeon H-GB2-1]|nr:PrsW family intramembrane metalloprotease [Haloarculaceae archaeon H-GB1-1]MEA5388853.1 PrsW family intramembrane metalloprotease [Haloarculaceae archaeon H-GB11]MEA5406910.1 PrsW family intramembrane metalloprotease [Haloarculaceae archaeon H-GB2-1]